jgi:hypothetical protein
MKRQLPVARDSRRALIENQASHPRQSALDGSFATTLGGKFLTSGLGRAASTECDAASVACDTSAAHSRPTGCAYGGGRLGSSRVRLWERLSERKTT